MYIDTHCHINKDRSKEYVDNAKSFNVGIMLTASEDYETSLDAINIANNFDCVFACIGVHPENVDDFKNEDISKFKELISNNKVKAIGEIGLDYYYGKENKDRQIEVFKLFLNLASEYNLPVVIHTRDAIEDTIRILKEYKVRGIIHCFSGSKETAKEYIKLGFKLGIGGVLTFKNSKLHETLENLDLTDIVLETDSPFLSPEPYRGKENESKNIPLIASCLANYLNKDVSEIENITTSNARAIFDI